jgi:AraC-like DNA-binding protein
MATHLAAAPSKSALTRWKTHGRAAAHEALRVAFPYAHTFELDSTDTANRFESSKLNLGRLTIYRTCTNGYGCRAEPNDAVRVTLPARGCVTVASRGKETRAVAGTSGIVCVHEAVDRRVIGPDYFGFHFQVLQDDLFSAARTLTGDRYEAHQIDDAIDLRAPVGASLFRNAVALFTEAERLADLGLGQLATARASELIVNLAAAAVLPQLRECLSPDPGTSAADRARQFIHAHAAEPVRLGVLADDLGVSLRALQSGFRKRFGCTPSDYLFRRRLELARGLLLGADDATSVTAVAVECGFVNVGAFAARYFRAFGERPSETLRGVRGHTLSS